MTRARNSANLASHGNLFVDITNDRTGIGSVVPDQNLHVAGTAGFHADVTFTGDLYNTTWDRSANTLKFTDNAKAKFGTGGDLEVYHDGSNSYVMDNGTGDLRLQTQGGHVRINYGTDDMAVFQPSGFVKLYHNNSVKFETTAYGTNTTGTAVNDGLVVAGVATVTTMNVTGVLTYDDVTSVDSVGIVTARQGVHIDDSIVHISDTNTKIRFPANDTISLETAGNESFRIDSIGRLLHGTTSSLIQDYRYRLQIQRAGSNALDSGILGLYFTGSSNASAQNEPTAIGFHKKESNGSALSGGIGIIRFNGHDGSNYVEAATIEARVDGNAGTNDMPGRITFSTTADGASSPTERLRINSSGTATFAGDVTVSGNLSVTGTTTQNNSVSTTEKTITLASGAANNAAVDGAGIVVDAGSDTDKTLKWLDSTDRWTFTGGDVSANAYYGDGSNLTGVTQTTINSNADNRVITGSGTADTLNAESGLTYNGSTLGLSGSLAMTGGSISLDSHPLISTANFTDISGGSYAARLGSTGSSTIRSTQIYGGGSHIATFDGVNYRLGINETAPDAALHISHVSAPTIRLENTDTSLTSGQVVGNVEFKAVDPSGIGANVIGSVESFSDSSVGGSYGLKFRVSTSGAANYEAMRIAQNGYVGLGGQTPDAHFHIEKLTPELRVQSTNANLGQGGTVCTFSHHTSDPTTPTGVGEVFRIKTYSANANGADYTTELVNRAGSGGGQSRIALGQGAVGAITFSTHASGNAAERLRITNTGRLGINNSSPQYVMHASHNGQGGNQRIDLHMTNDTTGHTTSDGVQFGYQNSAGAYIWNFENTDIYFATNNVARLYIKNDELRNNTPFYSNTPTITQNKTLGTSYNSMSVGNITINSSITVTVQSGARWVIV